MSRRELIKEQFAMHRTQGRFLAWIDIKTYLATKNTLISFLLKYLSYYLLKTIVCNKSNN